MPISVNAINFLSEEKNFCLIHDFCCIPRFLCHSQISVFGSISFMIFVLFMDFCYIHGFLSLVISKNNIYQILLFFRIHVMYLLIDILYINDKQTHSDQHEQHERIILHEFHDLVASWMELYFSKVSNAPAFGISAYFQS